MGAERGFVGKGSAAVGTGFGRAGTHRAVSYTHLEGPEQEQEREEGPLLDVLALRGFSYIQGGEHLALWEGEELILKREPDNPFDPKAVAVLRENGQRIGYLPREYNAIPAALLEEGILLTGRLRLGNYGTKEVEIHWPRN